MTEQFSPAMERFFEELRTRKGWYLDDGGAIRRDRVMQASGIGEVSYRQNPYNSVTAEIDGSLTALWDAEDNALGHNPALRARLLECCGLMEVAK